MEKLGKYFLDLRLERGISYAQVWDDLRISESQLKALEENRIFDLGNYGYVRSLIYSYARYLEADLDMVLSELKVLMPETTKQAFKPRRDISEKKILLSINFFWTLGIIIFVAILGSILWHAYRHGHLKAPDFFVKERVEVPSKEEKEVSKTAAKPDSLRQRMRELSESIKDEGSISKSSRKSIPRDTTDYIGNILGKSPVNVPIN
ncbi:MAG: helix-turn-helix domain-containing protein [Candidatus Cloacimonetes bacterium]|nr:helix-turn-helix domain-containing protein [Candidatus Cloacimonadota bacterium]